MPARIVRTGQHSRTFNGADRTGQALEFQLLEGDDGELQYELRLLPSGTVAAALP